MDDLISRKAAIDALFELYEYQRDIDPTEAADLVRQGVYLAEKKIEQLPSAQPETHDKRTETHACDLIDRQAAIDVLMEILDKPNHADFLYTDEIYKALNGLPSAQSEQRWIPVTERLPDVGQWVLCQCRANIMDVFRLTDDDDWYRESNKIYMGGFVLAWMPLPEPYKEDEQ